MNKLALAILISSIVTGNVLKSEPANYFDYKIDQFKDPIKNYDKEKFEALYNNKNSSLLQKINLKLTIFFQKDQLKHDLGESKIITSDKIKELSYFLFISAGACSAIGILNYSSKSNIKELLQYFGGSSLFFVPGFLLYKYKVLSKQEVEKIKQEVKNNEKLAQLDKISELVKFYEAIGY